MAGVQELLQFPADLSLWWSPAGTTEPRPSKPSPLLVWPRLRYSPGTETCPWMNTRTESSTLAIQKRVRRGGWSLLWETLARPKREPFSPGPPRQPAAPQLAQGIQVGRSGLPRGLDTTAGPLCCSLDQIGQHQGPCQGGQREKKRCSLSILGLAGRSLGRGRKH